MQGRSSITGISCSPHSSWNLRVNSRNIWYHSKRKGRNSMKRLHRLWWESHPCSICWRRVKITVNLRIPYASHWALSLRIRWYRSGRDSWRRNKELLVALCKVSHLILFQWLTFLDNSLDSYITSLCTWLNLRQISNKQFKTLKCYANLLKQQVHSSTQHPIPRWIKASQPYWLNPWSLCSFLKHLLLLHKTRRLD